MALKVVIDGKETVLKTDAEVLAYVARLEADKAAESKKREEAEKAAAEAKNGSAAPTGFAVRLAKYSSKANRQTGKVHDKAGQPKGTFEIFACGSQFGIAFAVDQWEAIKANVAAIDKFVEENRKDLKTMAQIINGK